MLQLHRVVYCPVTMKYNNCLRPANHLRVRTARLDELFTIYVSFCQPNQPTQRMLRHVTCHDWCDNAVAYTPFRVPQTQRILQSVYSALSTRSLSAVRAIGVRRRGRNSWEKRDIYHGLAAEAHVVHGYVISIISTVLSLTTNVIYLWPTHVASGDTWRSFTVWTRTRESL